MGFSYVINDTPAKLEALINGELLPYDACSDCSLAEAKQFYIKLDYIGTSRIMFINGVLNNWSRDYHFFTRKT